MRLCADVRRRQKSGDRRRRERPYHFAAPSGGDSRVVKQTTAIAPIPLCPPTPSLGQKQVNGSGRVELLAAVHGYRRMVRRKVPTFVQAQGVHFFFFPRPAFSTVCALSSLTGRRLKGYVRGRRRLEREEDVVWLAGNGVVAFRRLMLNYPKMLIPNMI